MSFSDSQVISSILVLLDVLLESLLLFMIVFKTPKAMAKFKLYLTLLCWNSLFMSLCIGFIWQPQFLTPPLCIYSLSLFSGVVTSTVLASVTSMLEIQNILFLLLSYYFVYSQMNCNVGSKSSHGRIAFEVLFVALPSICVFVLMLHGNSSNSYIENHTVHKLRDHPNMICYFIGDFQADGLVHYAIALIAICCISFIILTAFMLVQIRRRLESPPSYMSAYNLRLHKMFFTNIIVQSITPLVCIFFPLMSVIAFVAFGTHSPPPLFITFVSLTALLNSILSSLVIIYLTKPYREYVLSKVKGCRKKLIELSFSQ